MRLHEFNSVADSTSRLLTVLNYLRAKYKESGQIPKIKTQSIINMVKNAGDPSFGYESLVAAQRSNETVRKLIKNTLSDEYQDTIDLSSSGIDDIADKTKFDPEQTVGTMAKRALGRRN